MLLSITHPLSAQTTVGVVRRIVRGLAYHHGLGTAISDHRVWTDILKYPIQAGLLESITLRRPEHDIFQYWFEECIDDEISSIWYLTFFEKRIFVASISARESIAPAHLYSGILSNSEQSPNRPSL
jgi:hypothetical protein